MTQSLKIDKDLDKHLKVLKSESGELSSLEVSSEGNGARISGDFAATGYTDNIKLREEAIIQSDGNVKLDSAGDITLDASGHDITFGAGGTAYLTWSATGSLVMKSVLDTGDILQFTVGGNAVSEISTVDNSGGNLADFKLDIDGDITLDSGNGVFIMKNDGDKFADMYAGMILGYTAIGIDAAADSLSVGAVNAVTDADHKVTFVAPPSGKVEIEISISILTTSARYLILFLADTALGSPINFPNTDDVTNQHMVGTIQVEAEPKLLIHKWVVEGLTAGTEYTWYLGARAEQAGRVRLSWGGDAVDEYPPFIMKATALPATIYTG